MDIVNLTERQVNALEDSLDTYDRAFSVNG